MALPESSQEQIKESLDELLNRSEAVDDLENLLGSAGSDLAVSGKREESEDSTGSSFRESLIASAKDKGLRKDLSRPPMSVSQKKAEQKRIEKNQEKWTAAFKIKIKKAELKLQQHRRKILLAGCEPVMGLNFNSLAMDDYPDNATVAAARRDRDYWAMICVVFSCVFASSFAGLTSPWIGGVACGLTFISAIFAFTPVRKYFFERPHLHQLLAQRKTIEYTALQHIQFLEGVEGLAWRCEKLSKFNSNLDKNLFKGLYLHSKARDLNRFIINKKTIRLYLLLMIEAQKAYKRLEKDYLESHFKHFDQGWDDRIDDKEALELEKMLNDVNSEREQESIS